MNKIKEFISNIDFEMILLTFGVILGVCIVLGLAGTSIYCFITYGGKPINEMPAWALFFMFNWGR